ncbi:hypothetical protein IEQ34_016153 [Dendrobium chrysotoxum]|uniref:Uncharacterized protein n=1 Tax=Dendrobium chrysotoxum TaxID=161865 RepID=A0AAV7FXB0_DENCH|nr:hypothetical protein IEQ34_016153 [Dendrobium chrysotoxum]
MGDAQVVARRIAGEPSTAERSARALLLEVAPPRIIRVARRRRPESTGLDTIVEEDVDDEDLDFVPALRSPSLSRIPSREGTYIGVFGGKYGLR